MREAWRELLFADEDVDAKDRRDPLAPAQRSAKALRKASTHRLADSSLAHSFRTLLEELACVVRNTCRARQDESGNVCGLCDLPIVRRSLNGDADRHR
jgi:hypothetical protein